METELQNETPRPPRQVDLISLCRALNHHNVEYIVVGGMAMIQQGYLRATEDIDLLLEDSPENISRAKGALEILPDKAIREMEPADLATYSVIRIVDAIVVDLMLRTCGISYQE